METLLRNIILEPQTEALAEFAKHNDILDDGITVDCSTLTNHCICATNFEYLHKPDHLLQCFSKRKCFHCQRYKCMNKDHDTVTATTKLILIAAALGKFEILKFLCQSGCSLEAKSGIFELRPLHLSIVHGHFNIFCYLLTQKVDVNAAILSHGTTYSPLMLAVIYKQEDMVRHLLMARDTNVAYRNSLLQSPVMFAVQNNSLELINLLLSAEDNRAVKRKATDSRHRVRVRKRSHHPGALLEALKQDNAAVLKVLLENGCNVDYVFKGYHVHTSALVLSTVRNSCKCLEVLLQSGAKDNTVQGGYTAEEWATLLHWDECIELLRNGETEVQSEKNLFVSKHSVSLGTEESFSSNLPLEECMADVMPSCDNNVKEASQTKNKLSASKHLAAPMISIWGLVQWMDISDTLRRLVDQGHDVNVRDKFGRTSLHLAVEEQSRAGLRTLLQLGANPELTDFCNATPFWHAVFWNKQSMIQELVFANVTLECKAQKDAFKLGVPWQNVQPFSAGSTEKHHKSALYFAVKKNFTSTVRLLLQAGYDIKTENMDKLLVISKDEIRSLLLEYMNQPRSLLELTRNFVRRQCGMKIHKLAEGLDVPIRIKDCLLLRDVVDLKIEPVLVHL